MALMIVYLLFCVLLTWVVLAKGRIAKLTALAFFGGYVAYLVSGIVGDPLESDHSYSIHQVFNMDYLEGASDEKLLRALGNRDITLSWEAGFRLSRYESPATLLRGLESGRSALCRRNVMRWLRAYRGNEVVLRVLKDLGSNDADEAVRDAAKETLWHYSLEEKHELKKKVKQQK